MNSLQKSSLLVMGCLVLVFVVSIGLSWWNYGFLDLKTTAIMAAMLLPVLIAAGLIVYLAGRAKPTPLAADPPHHHEERPAARQEARPPAAARREEVSWVR